MRRGHSDKSLHKKLLPLFPVDLPIRASGRPYGKRPFHTLRLLDRLGEPALDLRVGAEPSARSRSDRPRSSPARGRIALARAVQGVSAAVAGVATSPGGVDLRGDHPPVRRRRRLGVVRGRRCAGRAPIRAGAIRPQADVAGAAASLIASSLSADVPPERNAMNEVEESPRGLFGPWTESRSPAQDSELGLALREGPDRGPACAAGSRPLGGRLRPLQPGDPVLAWRDRGPTGIDGPAARWELMRE
jgi:hypothetical protein